METFLETGSGRSRRGGRADGLGRFQESLTICDQLTDTEQVRTSFSPMDTWLPEVRAMVGGGT